MLDRIAAVLLERELLDGKEFEALMNGEELPEKPVKNGASNGTNEAALETPGSDTAEIPEMPEEKTDALPEKDFLA